MRARPALQSDPYNRYGLIKKRELFLFFSLLLRSSVSIVDSLTVPAKGLIADIKIMLIFQT